MYSGAFRRFFAYLIDLAVIVGSYMLLGFVLSLSAALSNPLLLLPMLGIWYFLGLLFFGWLYFALQESSVRQATIGKRALGLKVADLEGNRISFLRATARYYCKLLSRLMLMIGYLMIFWTAKKQALHDKMASTVVLYDARIPKAAAHSGA